MKGGGGWNKQKKDPYKKMKRSGRMQNLSNVKLIQGRRKLFTGSVQRSNMSSYHVGATRVGNLNFDRNS